jgi:hypothetical protein
MTHCRVPVRLNLAQSSQSPIPPWVADFEPDKSFQLDAAVLSRALSTAPSLSAGGPSGLLYEHYRDVLAEDSTAFAAFHVVCSLVARGQMPPRARAALSSCRLLAMGIVSKHFYSGVRNSKNSTAHQPPSLFRTINFSRGKKCPYVTPKPATR